MNKIFISLALLTLLLIPQVLQAQATRTLSLTLAPNFASQVCAKIPRKEGRILWQGVQDKRPQSELGYESKKKFKDPIAVFANPLLENLFEDALKTILTSCGWTLVKEAEPGVLQLSAQIEEFQANVERGVILGKGKASSRLVLIGKLPQKEWKARVGYEIEFKKTRGLSLKRLGETLNELFAKTLEQVPSIEILR